MTTILKYFNFKNTISGTSYFLRILSSSTLGFVGGTMIGLGIKTSNKSLISLGVIIATVGILLQVSTLYKRILGLFKEHATQLTILMIFSQFLASFNTDEIHLIGMLISLVFSFILIFFNSSVDNHEG